ncbi:MAG: phytoene desaturase family protein [Candidatus Thorarchaeota archaeon]
MKVIIIGSGISGLTAGAYLVREGHDVTIYEQYSEIGGVTATLHKDGFSWDMGPLLLEGFATHEKLGKVLAELGLDGEFELINDDRGQSFPDFQIWCPNDFRGSYWRRDYFKKLFPVECDGLDRYYKFYDKMMSIMYLNNQVAFTKGVKAIVLKLKLVLKFLRVKKYNNWSATQIMDLFFNDEKLKAIFLGILADLVVRPSKFFGLGIPSFNVETAFDKRIPVKFKGGKYPTYHYIKNGCEQMVNVFANYIRDKGGRIFTNNKVTKILIENSIAKGVKLENGKSEKSDIIIASGGILNTFYNLVGRQYLPEDFTNNIEELSFMESVFFVNIGIDFDPSPFQRKPLCYYYGTYDIEGGINNCIQGNYHEGKDGFLIYIPSMHSPEMAPKNKHAVTIYTIAPHNLKDGNWSERKEEYTEKLLIEAERYIPDLRNHIITKLILTPDDFKSRINVVRHSFGGMAPIIGQKNPSHKTPIENLWFIGAYSESGGGVAGAALGARNTIEQVLNKRL